MSKIGNISHLISEEQENKNLLINSNDSNNNISKIINSQPQLTKKYSIDELNYLKDDIMYYFKQKFEEYSTNLYENIIKINKIEKNFEEMTNNININYNKIIDTQAKMQSELDKVKNYDSFSNNVNDKLISHEVRLNNLREEFSKATQKYDKIYLDNLELPGFIGRCAKYKNCQIFFNEVIKNLGTLNQIFFNEVIKNLGTLNQFREKNILDLKSYKEKLENIIKSFNILVDNNNKAQIKYVNSLNQKNITDCKNMMDILDEKIRDVKVDNAKYSLDIMRKTEEMHKKWDKIEKIKDEIFEEFNKKSNEFNKINSDTLDKFDEFKKEYKIIRDKFFELADFIKDIRFQKNIKNIYSQILYRKNIKSICKSLNELNDIKNYEKGDEKDLELIKNISTIERMNFKINKNNSTCEQNLNTSQDLSPDKLNEYIHNKTHHIKKSVEYNSPYKSNKINRNDRISLIRNNKTIDYTQKSFNNKDLKNLSVFSYQSSGKIENDKEKEKEESKNNIYNNYIKKKSNQKIIIESKFETSTPSKKKTIKKPSNEDSNSIALDNQSTNANYNNSNSNTVNDINNNNYSFSSVSAFSLNYNNNNPNANTNANNKISFNDICLQANDKVIKEMASELEQSTAKKDYKPSIKEKIEPKNLNKEVKEEKENLDTSNSNKNNKKDNIKNTIRNSKDIKSNSSLKKESNELILYGNNPKAIDKKFFMTEKKLLDLEEFTKDKFMEIKSQIEKLKVVNPDVNQNKLGKSNALSFNSYRDKGTIFSNNTKNEGSNTTNSSFTKNVSNKLKFLNQKINENKSARKKLENNKKEFDLTCHNFRKNKFYNFEQISQKIFNSSCKKIKTYANDEKEKEKEKEKNLVSPRAKEYIKNKIVSRNDINAFDPKKSENNFFYEKKKWETIDNIKVKNNDSKRQKNRNISSGNIYLTKKNGECVSFNEADIKLVYLNKFVNNKLPYAPGETFLGEKK